MIIYCDGIFDMLHFGHIEHFRKAKNLYDDVFLIVGVNSDEDATGYKRKPIMDEQTRYDLVESIKYVDKVIRGSPMVTTREFIEKHKIDYVVHSFSTPNDLANQGDFFDDPRKMGIMKELSYTKGISTTDIINQKLDESCKDWKMIWNKKGLEEHSPAMLSGYENTDQDPMVTSKEIIESLEIKDNNKILEVGCGNGYLANSLNSLGDFDYTGIDYSQSLAFKHYKTLKNKVIICEAYPLPFPDNYFDAVFANGVFEYFPSKEYTRKVIEEMNRVSKNKVYILNMRLNVEQDTSKYKYEGNFKHNALSKEFFTNNLWEIKDATWDKKDRFSALSR